MVKIKEANARPETLLPAELWCTKPPDPGCNNGFYEVKIPLIYLTEALEKPAQFYLFKFIGLKGNNGQAIYPRKH